MENNKNYKPVIAIIVIIVIIVIVLIGIKIQKEEQNGRQVGNLGEFVEMLADGTKQNKSEKLKETKKLEGLEIKNINIRTNKTGTNIIADVTNTTKERVEGFEIEVIVYDKDRNILTRLNGYMNSIEAGKTSEWRISTSSDCSNAYDIAITRQETR